MPKPRTKRMKWKISKLKKHPKQDAIFGDLPPEQRQALLEDVKRNGQRQPIEILPDGTIIKGHQRYLVALMLGWIEIDVIVRYDLAEQGDDAVEVEFIGDNLFRRQLSPLARARCIKRLMELEEGVREDGLGWMKKEELKSNLAEQLRMSLRTVNRQMLVLQAPHAVQQAFDRGEITLVNAGKVALLGKREQQEIARRIEGGEDAGAVVARFLKKPEGRHVKVNDAVASLVRNLVRGREDLEGRLEEVSARTVQKHLGELRQAKVLISQLIGKAAK